MHIISTDTDRGIAPEAWNAYLAAHDNGSLYAMAQWGDVVREVYGHRGIRLAAFETRHGAEEVVGVLPLVDMRSRIFGHKLVSMPYVDMAGVVADSPEIERALVERALELGKEAGADCVEVRQAMALSSLGEEGGQGIGEGDHTLSVTQDKARMVLALPDSSEALWSSFKSKLRNQISRGTKEGLTVRVGGDELVSAFYTVFAENMRDLGSPVHAKKLFYRVMETFTGKARIVLVEKEGEPVSAAMVCAFEKALQNPWASTRRRFNKLSPNMLLYWSMLEYACNQGYATFDFGRSTPGEGTYRFKKQWGPEPYPLYWYRFTPGEELSVPNPAGERDRFGKVMACWKRLPVPVTRIIGPMVRGQISL
ncbi:FemAB family XrtA/PEP-CTERM system-associated protein [Desulfoluna spongiiphila]|uniref:FemAB-related protein, PEP-CTERM system-associated n=1 Tax=Desulfoluna spongiiphila TaxID=419481 RepID=A0A1G5C289_9BACT|nr:FemAB family XrtA/PEP-CTERM system-associated protein [Desulfoluna spongiiphila]SCX96535.1 FemAB-related protein, PEP-CTERM system-associated [Desulfoluna spongiiphila]